MSQFSVQTLDYEKKKTNKLIVIWTGGLDNEHLTVWVNVIFVILMFTKLKIIFSAHQCSLAFKFSPFYLQ